MVIFPTFQGQLTPYIARDRIWPDLEIIPDMYYGVFRFLQNVRDPIKNVGARVLTSFSPLQPHVSYLLPWKSELKSINEPSHEKNNNLPMRKQRR